MASEIFRRRPTRHLDVGSRIDGFVSHVAAFREIEVLDIRPLRSEWHEIRFLQADLLNLPPSLRGQFDSVSCLHALEHIGLGRYGDPVEFDGWRRGLESLTALLGTDGILYLSVPTGLPQRVEFNAHRVFSLAFLRDQLLPDFEVLSLAFVDDGGSLHTDLDAFDAAAERSFDARYGCSIWVLRKRDASI